MSNFLEIKFILGQMQWKWSIRIKNILLYTTDPVFPNFVFQVGPPPKTRFGANIFDSDFSQHPKVSNHGGKSRLYHVLNEDLVNVKLIVQDWLYYDPLWKLA